MGNNNIQSSQPDKSNATNNDSLRQFIKDEYLNKGFGTMNKNDFEVFIFNEIMKAPHEILGFSKKDEDGKSLKPSNYDLSILLKIPESKVKRLAYEADLKYGAENRETECNKRLQEALHKVKLSCESKGKNARVSFFIEEVAMRKYLEHKIKSNGDFVDYHNNEEVVSVGVKEFSDLIQGFYKKEIKEDIMAELKSATRADFKEILPQILNSVAQKKLGDAVSIAGGALLNLVKTHSGDIIKAITNNHKN